MGGDKLIFQTGNPIMCQSPIFFVVTYAVVLEKLRHKCSSVSARIGFLGVKTAPENLGTQYPSNCFTYNSGIFHNETHCKNFLTIRNEKCDAIEFFEKFVVGELRQNYY